MPPPTNKPSPNSKPSTSRRPSAIFFTDEKASSSSRQDNKSGVKMNDLGLVEGTEAGAGSVKAQESSAPEAREALAQSESLPSLRPGNSLSTGSTRLSFSSLSNLGVVYNGTSGGGSSAPSVASSTAGSVRNSGVDHIPAPSSALSPSNVSTRSTASGKEGPSHATTATDTVSVTSKSHAPNSGLCFSGHLRGQTDNSKGL